MSRIIRKREFVEGDTVYNRQFDWEGHINCGFAFDCDKNGNVNIDRLQPGARDSYAQCLANSFTNQDGSPRPIVDRGVTEWKMRGYWEPAVLKCDCGAHVQLSGFTNTCDQCEADYNMSGQKLADRSQWGHETGESLADILSADSDMNDYDYGCP